MQEQLISFETAKLAKEKGFVDIVGNWRGKHYYNHLGQLDGDIIESLRKTNRDKEEFQPIAAPTQSLLQKWLREEHQVHIEIDLDTDDAFYILKPYKYVIDVYQDVDHKFFKEYFDSYEEALERGLQEGLKLIE